MTKKVRIFMTGKSLISIFGFLKFNLYFIARQFKWVWR